MIEHLTRFDTIGSTNDAAREAAAAGAVDGAAFLADAQTAGRGRGDHRWHSPPGENVYLSVLLRPRVTPQAMSALTLAVGVEVARVVDAVLPEPRAMIKWPNDVYVDDRKLAGILVESTVQGDRPPVVVVGVGLNVLTAAFPDELAERATSLKIAGARAKRDAVAEALIVSIRATARRYVADGLAPWLDELRRRDWLGGKAVRVGERRGTAEGIDREGRLLVNGTPCASGEVELL